MADLDVTRADAVLIGGGIASATLAAMLTELEPDWNIVVLEKLDNLGQESSDGWNNAGTGHSALCELNYTPQDVDGSVSPAKAISINEQFQVSRQFWAHLVETDRIGRSLPSFIHTVPHMSFVHGMENVDYLRRRHEALAANPLFDRMDFTTEHAQLAEWAPLVTEGRPVTETIAATYSPDGTDVDFGALTRQMLDFACRAGTTVATGSEVIDLRRMGEDWGVMVRSTNDDSIRVVRAPYRLRRRGRLRPAAPPEVRNRGDPRLRRVPDLRPVAAVHGPRDRRPPRCEGLRQGRRRRAADERPPSRHPLRGRQAITHVRSVRGLDAEVPQDRRYTDLFESIKPSNITQMMAVAAAEPRPHGLPRLPARGHPPAALRRAARVHARRPATPSGRRSPPASASR